ncbi:GDT1-like protein 1, chloroplastic isoform X2 [Cryptomeria japonica]|uniref:GDT1-like protein 1, chloroplastic isoform X2 n=1 Tax=Cryptomeria japonica TaxID=3369 RepID=UPI0025AD61C1|nr:GDT1-like protein 1, chloroplastic isoform X2 [Cryptomeria japonica]
MITIQWAYGPSMGISAFKTTKAKGESNYTQRMRSLQALPASAAAPKRHSNKSPWCIRRDLGSDLKQLADLPVSMIDHEYKSWDETIPVDIGYQIDSFRIQDDDCALEQNLPINRTLQFPSLSFMHLMSKTEIFVDKSHLFDLLKIATLTGIFSLQDYHQALATTDIGSVIQSASWLGDLGDISTGFTSAFLLIFFSELGDKTFFIAALLASRKSTAAVFLGTFGALAVMTVISVFLGRTFHYVDGIVPIRLGQMELPLDDLAAVGLLVYFGVSTLLEASSGDESKTSNEKDEAELAIAGVSGGGAGILAAANTVISTFALVFVAEWGDKSFFSTIDSCFGRLSISDISIGKSNYIYWRSSVSSVCSHYLD